MRVFDRLIWYSLVYRIFVVPCIGCSVRLRFVTIRNHRRLCSEFLRQMVRFPRRTSRLLFRMSIHTNYGSLSRDTSPNHAAANPAIAFWLPSARPASFSPCARGPEMLSRRITAMCNIWANERTSGNAAVALRFHIGTQARRT